MTVGSAKLLFRLTRAVFTLTMVFLKSLFNVLVGARVLKYSILKIFKFLYNGALCLVLTHIVDSAADHHIHWFLLPAVLLVEDHREVPDPSSHHRLHLKVDTWKEALHLPEVDERTAGEQDFASVWGLDWVHHATHKAVVGVDPVLDCQLAVVLVAFVIVLDDRVMTWIARAYLQ